ncbi:MAG: Hpt domain-containing protein [Syntrophobacterales bacterium]|nr:Hpt domain-containing protein [Syntrophobacterales bacterium]
MSSSVFNKEAILARLEGDEELVKIVVEVFISDFPNQFQSLKDALKEGRLQDAVRYAHSIKGASSNVSAERLQALALKMEESLKNGDLTFTLQNLPLLEKEFQEFVKAVTSPV